MNQQFIEWYSKHHSDQPHQLETYHAQSMWAAWRASEQAALSAERSKNAAIRNQFSREEIDLFRQWYNSMQDCNPGYLGSEDHLLGQKVLRALSDEVKP